jgi:hypothetical protein
MNKSMKVLLKKKLLKSMLRKMNIMLMTHQVMENLNINKSIVFQMEQFTKVDGRME